MRRLLFVDDNIRTLDGHYIELATLLCHGAQQLGYETELATHIEFHNTSGSDLRWSSAFTTSRMLGWSLGVDGDSQVARDPDGRPNGSSSWRNAIQFLHDQFNRTDRRPRRLLETWSHDLLTWLERVKVTPGDRLIVNTSDDFQMLGLTRALKVLGESSPKNVHLVFHFAIFGDSLHPRRPREFGVQVKRALADLAAEHPAPPVMHLHATTQPLTDQLNAVGIPASLIPYPTRYRQPIAYPNELSTPALNLLLGGWPRREKGTKSTSRLLKSIEQPLLRQHRYRVSMQAMLKKWKRITPRSLHPHCRLSSNYAATLPAATPGTRHPEQWLSIITSSITSAQYHDWLDTADVGLFLYDPQRYVARCSSVLLEFMIRGIPVVVPDRCWLAEQVREAGAPGAVGAIYQTVDEIPRLLAMMADDYTSLRRRSLQYSRVIADRHHPQAALLAMGIQPVKQTAIAA